MCKINNQKNCNQCTFPCYMVGDSKLIPITIEELRKMGYTLCDDYTTLPIEEQA